MTQHRSKLEMFLAHRTALVDYATPITGCRARAEDVVQDAYLRFQANTTEQASSLSTGYLYRIVRNLAFDLMRRASMESRYQSAGSVSWLAPAMEPDPEQRALHHGELAQVADVLRGLPERQRVAVEMHRFGGYTLQDIATRLGVSAPTVHRLIRDAMLQVARRLDNPSDSGTVGER